MKKLLSAVMAFTLIAFVSSDKTITEKERKHATTLLQDTYKAFEKSIEGLSEEQINFKAGEDKWSIDGNIRHLAAVEQTILNTVEDALKRTANPDKRADIKVNDEQLVKNYEDRSNKVKTLQSLEPQSTTFATTADALASLKQNREKTISFVNSTKDDLRNHVIAYPFGSYDSYQSILILAGHMTRHVKQIEEVKAQTGYPGN